MNRRIAIGAAVAGIVFLGLSAIAAGSPAAFARGWLCAFVLATMVPVGSLALLMVHGLCGGKWGVALKPVLEPAARLTLILIPAFLPVIFLRALIYAWPERGIPADVVRLYMNPLFFDIRSLVILAVWAALAWFKAWRSRLFAGIGLSLHLVCLSFAPPDWILSVQVGSASAAFGLGVGVEQVLAALGFAALAARGRREITVTQDLSAMIVAALLGTIYFVYVQFVIIWYGNLPEHAAWYVTRSAPPWPEVGGAAFSVGALLPFLMLLSAAIRKNENMLRIAGGAIVFGVGLHLLWMLLPSLGAAVALPGALAIIGLGVLLLAVARYPAVASGGFGHA